MVENIQMVPRERISEGIEEQIVDIPVLRFWKEIANVMLSSHVAASAAPTLVNDFESPSPVFEYIAPAP